MIVPTILRAVPRLRADIGSRRIWPVALGLGLALSTLFQPAADLRAQSPFSLINIGANIETSDARMTGRGGWGMAEQDTLIPAFKNVASLTDLKSVVIQLSGFAESRQSETDAAERTTNRVMTPSLRAAIPMFGGKGALTAGFRALRSTQYKTLEPKSVAVDTGDVYYDEQFVREGTQFEIPIGAAWRLHRILSLGASVNLQRGNIREILNILFRDDADFNGVPDYIPANREMKDGFTGTSTTFSLLFKPHSRLRFGASFTPSYGIEVQRDILADGIAAKADSTFDMTLPHAWSAGASYRIAPRWSLGVDYDLRVYSEFSGRDDWAADMLDEWTWSFGLERGRGTAREGGMANMPLRVGASLRRWGYRIGGEEIHETRLIAGTGFPFRRGGGHLDVALSYSWLGDRQQNGIADKVWRLTLSVAGLEKWW